VKSISIPAVLVLILSALFISSCGPAAPAPAVEPTAAPTSAPSAEPTQPPTSLPTPAPTEPSAVPTEAEPAVEFDTEGWGTYTNEPLGYSLMVPPDATVLEGTDGRSIQITGPLVDNERWPFFEVRTFDSDFYHPPADVDLRQWVLDHVPAHDAVDTATQVAGRPTVHLRHEASQQAGARDEYYVVDDGQLFTITILHSGREDWALYDAFLNGFRFSSAPAVEAGSPVVAWGGFVKGQPAGGQFDDCLALEPQGAGEVGLSGADEGVEAQIQALRDSGTYAHFWGSLICPAIDCGGCQLLVELLREDRPGPVLEPDAVEGWEGTIVGLPGGAQFDDAFVLAGDFPVGFGIDSTHAGIAADLASLRDTGTAVRIWGEVEVNVPDAFGTHIDVDRLEVLEEEGGAAD